MTGISHQNLPATRKLVLLCLRIGKWVFSAIWIVVIAGIADSTISTWLTSKKLDLAGTPLGWIIQNLLTAILSSFCLLLLTIFIWVVYFFLEHDSSWLYTENDRQRSKMRQLFSMHIEHEIERISIQEDWKDYQFTELEAEVEARGRQKISKPLFFRQSSDRLRHEKSLSEALRKSAEKIILVEGEPGSGKSVALRHVALKMIEHTKNTQATESVYPIYVNMKLLERKSEEKINRDLIEAFIEKTLERSNDRDVQRFLDNEFQNGMRDGSFFFLFDSFDEIPEILNSIEADDKVNDYGQAIDDFLHGMNQCRGIIASRFYRGPTRMGWTRFRIMPLSEKRQLELISKTNLTVKAKWVVGQLGNANQTIRSMASNPFFLALLCKYLDRVPTFPENVHVVYETYIDQRFTDDEKEVQRNYRADIIQVRVAAETIAFCMTASPSLGLNPTRTALQNALATLGLSTDDSLEKFLDALEYMKLARPDNTANTSLSKSFTFSHRRFQEYFATCFVLHEPILHEFRRVTPLQLLTLGSWRETAVVLCQTQPIEKISPLMKEVERLLAGFCDVIPDLINDPMRYVQDIEKKVEAKNSPSFSRFSWPTGLFHLLSLLQEGSASRSVELSNTIRTHINQLILSATVERTRDDKKWALEVAGIASRPILEYLLKEAFSSESQWLKEVAYRQVARLSDIPPSIAKGIRYALVGLAASKRLEQEQQVTEAHLKRLNKSTYFLSEMRFLLWFPFFDSISFFLFVNMFVLRSSNIPFNNLDFSINKVELLFEIFIITFIFYLHKISSPGVFYLVNIISINDDWFGRIRLFLSLFTIFISSLLTFFFIVEISVFTFGKNYFSNIIITFIALYTGLFMALALGAVLTGNYTKRRWWVFIPIWPIIYLLQHPSLTFEYIQKNYKLIFKYKNVAIGILIIIPLVLFLNINAIAFLKLLEFIINLIFVQIIVFFIIGIVTVLIVLLYIMIVFYAIIDLSKSTILEIKFSIWNRKFRGNITLIEILKIFEEYRLIPNIYRRTIRFVRGQHGISSSLEVVKFLEEVTFKIEKRQKQDNRRKIGYKRKGRLFSNFLFVLLEVILDRNKSSSKRHFLNKFLRKMKIRKTIRRQLKRTPITGEELLILHADDAALDELYELLNDIRISNNTH